MKVESLVDGIVIDHIEEGKGMAIYNELGLGDMNVSVAIIKKAVSKKMEKKDILKIDHIIEINEDIVGYLSPGASISVVKNGKVAQKKRVSLPDTITDIVKCMNPRCITSCEQELKQIFKLANSKKRIYRCLYCETRADKIQNI